MTLTRNTLRWLLAALSIAALVSCEDPPGPSARFRNATAEDPVLPKGGDPIGALPSHVLYGEVAAYEPAPAGSGLAKRGDLASPLPSQLARGGSAVYRPAAPDARAASRPAPVPE